MILNFLFLPVIFLIGAIISWQDFKTHKIRNKWIILGLVFGIIVYFLFFLWNLLGKSPVSNDYILKVIINAVISLFIAYAMWYFNLWPAGDAKLFFLFSFLLPLTYYRNSYLPLFPSFALLINIFIIALFSLFILSILYFIKNFSFSQQITIQSAIIKLKLITPLFFKKVIGILLIFIFFLGIKKIFEKFIFHINIGFYYNGLLMFFIFIGFYFLKKIFKNVIKNQYFILSIAIIPIIIFLGCNSFLLNRNEIISSFKSFLLFFVLFDLFRFFLYTYTEKSEEKYLPVAFFMFLGIILTIWVKGSILSFLSLNF